MPPKLEPITPQDAQAMYLHSRTDIADSTQYAHEKRTDRFIDWCDKNEIKNINDLRGRDIHQYRIDEFTEKDDGEPYSAETVRGYLDTLRIFLRFAADIDAVPVGLAEKVSSPRPGKSRSKELDADRATHILENLATYEYASLRHAFLHLLWRTAGRVGALRGIDLADVDLGEQRIRIQHQPREGTPLKNRWSSEREVAIKDDTARILGDYIEQHRHDVTDDQGREPLFTSKQGRRSIANLREIVYSVTRPCEWDGCPHDETPESCQAAQRRAAASKCPTSVSPHPVRRGAITHMLRSGVPKAVVSDRSDVSPDVLDEHYNELSAAEKAERRRGFLDTI
ncbi:tyrosine-type recombinase/integrase [Natrarchaeobaculum sulfurireducens]|uniref:XerD/XerC family integrase n=1 Tax=Natrarchaeobaculum sulfurireducens TaxID=2044521 RepID=A0A346PQI9_9EURY|nr:site-specific integrase [Natrarchaeobaculum sulfurireducens]AXR81784.1 XerD/XerC family integrase [Natrarchaeobaculum sulfurireducens]